MTDRKHREHTTTLKQKEQLSLYGVLLIKDEKGYSAFHMFGGYIGPYEDEQKLVQEAYDTWIEPKEVRTTKQFPGKEK